MTTETTTPSRGGLFSKVTNFIFRGTPRPTSRDGFDVDSTNKQPSPASGSAKPAPVGNQRASEEHRNASARSDNHNASARSDNHHPSARSDHHHPSARSDNHNSAEQPRPRQSSADTNGRQPQRQSAVLSSRQPSTSQPVLWKGQVVKDLSVAELQRYLSFMGLNSTGDKQTLIRRLERVARQLNTLQQQDDDDDDCMADDPQGADPEQPSDVASSSPPLYTAQQQINAISDAVERDYPDGIPIEEYNRLASKLEGAIQVQDGVVDLSHDVAPQNAHHPSVTPAKVIQTLINKNGGVAITPKPVGNGSTPAHVNQAWKRSTYTVTPRYQRRGTPVAGGRLPHSAFGPASGNLGGAQDSLFSKKRALPNFDEAGKSTKRIFLGNSHSSRIDRYAGQSSSRGFVNGFGVDQSGTPTRPRTATPRRPSQMLMDGSRGFRTPNDRTSRSSLLATSSSQQKQDIAKRILETLGKMSTPLEEARTRRIPSWVTPKTDKKRSVAFAEDMPPSASLKIPPVVVHAKKPQFNSFPAANLTPARGGSHNAPSSQRPQASTSTVPSASPQFGKRGAMESSSSSSPQPMKKFHPQGTTTQQQQRNTTSVQPEAPRQLVDCSFVFSPPLGVGVDSASARHSVSAADMAAFAFSSPSDAGVTESFASKTLPLSLSGNHQATQGGPSSFKAQPVGLPVKSSDDSKMEPSPAPAPAFAMPPKRQAPTSSSPKTSAPAAAFNKKAASALMAKFAQPAGTWKCPQCLVFNEPENTRCKSCEADKPAGLSDGSPKNAPAAETPKVPAHKANILAQFLPAQGTWKCPVCLVSNEPENAECKSCESKKPGNDSSAATGADKKESKTEPAAASAGKFSFGGEPADAASGPKFSFGGEPTAADTPAKAATGFSFGGEPASSTTPAPKFAFGGGDEPADSGKATVVFGTPAPKEGAKPLGMFGSSAAADSGAAAKDDKPAFSFGAPAAPTTDSGVTKTDKPAFSFGAPAATAAPESAKETESAKPAFSFGAPVPSAPSGGLFGGEKPAQESEPKAKRGRDEDGEARKKRRPPSSEDSEDKVTGAGLFGGKSADKSPAGGLFGAAPAAASSATSGGGLFGAPKDTDTQPSTGGLFGGSGKAADASKPEPAAGGLFGSSVTPTAGGGLFGASGGDSSKPSAPKSVAGAGLFGATAPAKPAASGGLFGAAEPAKPEASGGMFGAAKPASAAGGLFGAAKPAEATTGGLFGAAKPAEPAKTDAPVGGLFGAAKPAEPAKTDAPAGGLFGAAKPAEPAKPEAAAGGMFGAAKPAETPSTGMFGAAAPAASTSTPFGSSLLSSNNNNSSGSGSTFTFGAASSAAPPAAPSASGAAPFTFGAAEPAKPAGNTSTPFGGGASGAPSGFGAGANNGGQMSGFGAGAAANNNAPAPSPFGQPAQQPAAGGFGGNPAAPSPFGQPNPGNNPGTPFGQPNPGNNPGTPFGQPNPGNNPGTPFGQPNNGGGFGGGAPQSGGMGFGGGFNNNNNMQPQPGGFGNNNGGGMNQPGQGFGGQFGANQGAFAMGVGGGGGGGGGNKPAQRKKRFRARRARK